MDLSKTSHTVASLLQGVDFRLLNSPSGKSLDGQQIGAITVDSRDAAADSLFIALPGVVTDGHNFIEMAVAGGCRAIICAPGKLTEAQIQALPATVIEVEDTAKTYATVSANYFQRPSEQLYFLGITGTNGKTTVTYLLEEVLLRAGLTVGVIGTVNNRYTGRSGERKILHTRFTTPEAFLLQQLLREMVDDGVSYVIMEVSSHALAQSRVGSVLFDIAAFTNLSRDHLDYHAHMEAYFRAKTRLFSEHMREKGIAVLPAVDQSSGDREWIRLLQAICEQNCREVIRWGKDEGAEVSLQGFSTALDLTEMDIVTPSGRHKLSSPLIGRYNIDNILTVYALGLAMGVEETVIRSALATAAGAPGRVERVSTAPAWDSKGPVVLVDYAHTPDALEKVLTTVAALPRGELFCVFGCGGDRDKGKRSLMGEVVGRICDVAVITDDNPRTEDPDQIVAQIVDGLNTTPLTVKKESWLLARNSKDRGCVVIRDRQKAIEAAIRSASAGDIVVIAGKGHEPYQLTRQGKRFFDDCLEAKRVLFSWTAELVAAATSGRLQPGRKQAKLLGPVITDSRVVTRDGIFVALKGESHDAHDYAGQAVENGASCLVVEKKIVLSDGENVCQVIVGDTQQALGDLAARRRKALAGICDQVVIGLTGSCGKTTVKEMVAAILARMFPDGPDFPADRVLKTRGNFNNLIGLPLSLLPLDVHHRAAVLEMGMNQPGELNRLGVIGDPDISCITNIHGAHLEGLQSIEGVARAKEELFAATKESGLLVINLDDSRVRELSGKYPQRKITFAIDGGGAGQNPEMKPDIWSSRVNLSAGGVSTFSLHHGQEMIDVDLHIAGRHNVSNALCAAAIGRASGGSLEHIAAGLADFRPPDKRMEMVQAKSGFTIINDTYNANPASMAAGLQTLKMITKKRSVALVGDMLELGADSGKAHYGIGKLIAKLAIDYAGVVGEFREDVVHGALEHGFAGERIRMFQAKEDVADWIAEMVGAKKLGPEDAVLVKASRGLRFETIVAKIIDL